MHEFSIAQSLLNIVLEEAQRHGAARVSRVHVKVGAFSNVVVDSLRFSFDMIKEDTPAAEAELEVEEVPLRGLCRDCGAELNMSQPVFECPHCHSSEVEFTQGQELYIDYIEAE